MTYQKPLTHKDDCQCELCKPVIQRIISSDIPQAHTLIEHYEARRNGRLSIWGTTLGMLSAFWEWFLIKVLWNKVSPYFLSPLLVHKLYKVRITDGYALTSLSPFVWVWWAICTVVMVIAVTITGFCYAVLFAMFPVISTLYIPISIYSVIFELPATIINRDWNKRDTSKYSDARDNHFKCIAPKSTYAWIIWGICALSTIIVCAFLIVFYSA